MANVTDSWSLSPWYSAPVESEPYLVIDDGSNGSLVEIPPLAPAVIPGIGPLPFPEIQDKRPFAALFDGSVEQKPGCLEQFAEQCEERRRELKHQIIAELDEETDNEEDNDDEVIMDEFHAVMHESECGGCKQSQVREEMTPYGKIAWRIVDTHSPTTPSPSPESETTPPPHRRHKMTRSGHHY